jgi:phage terminase small subunit
MVLENSKHEQFCQVWLETGNKSEAYRKSHPNSLKWKDETVHNKASALSKKGEVLARYDQLQEDTVKAHGITIESLLKELDEARGIALTADTPQSSAAITATMNKAKLVGLDKFQVEVSGDIKVRKTLDDFYG